MILKTRSDLFERLRLEISSNHPYEVPEIIALPILEGHRPYLDWIKQVTSQAKES
jgi:periplasmic divalent cation tolerance protein